MEYISDETGVVLELSKIADMSELAENCSEKINKTLIKYLESKSEDRLNDLISVIENNLSKVITLNQVIYKKSQEQATSELTNLED